MNDETTDAIELQLTNLPSNIPKIKLFTTKVVEKEISYLNLQKAQGLDRIVPRMLKELPRKGTVLITHTFNSIFRESHWPEQLKTAEISLIPKPSKDLNNVESYRPISIFPIIAKVLNRLLIERMKRDPNTNE